MSEDTIATTQLSDEEIEGLEAVIRRGVEDRRAYVLDGEHPHIDYGSEWPEAARLQAAEFRQCASALRKLLGREDVCIADNCEDVAETLEISGKEYEEEIQQ